jgi:hypothetical protein
VSGIIGLFLPTSPSLSMTVQIRQADLIESVAAALQYIS